MQGHGGTPTPTLGSVPVSSSIGGDGDGSWAHAGVKQPRLGECPEPRGLRQQQGQPEIQDRCEQEGPPHPPAPVCPLPSAVGGDPAEVRFGHSKARGTDGAQVPGSHVGVAWCPGGPLASQPLSSRVCGCGDWPVAVPISGSETQLPTPGGTDPVAFPQAAWSLG